MSRRQVDRAARRPIDSANAARAEESGCQTAADAGLDGSQGLIEVGGDFLLGEAPEERQLDRPLLVVGQRGKRLAHRAGPLAGLERFRRIGGGASAGLPVTQIGGRGVGEDFRAAATLAHAIDRAVARHGHGPAERTPAVRGKLHRALPQGQKDIVNDVLGFSGVPEDSERGGEQRPGKTVVESGERRAIPLGGALDQIEILPRLGGVDRIREGERAGARGHRFRARGGPVARFAGPWRTDNGRSRGEGPRELPFHLPERPTQA
jgi:hypothetical protein